MNDMTSRKEIEMLGKSCISCKTKLVKTVDDNDEFNGHVTCPNTTCPRGWLLTASFFVDEYRLKKENTCVDCGAPPPLVSIDGKWKCNNCQNEVKMVRKK